MPLLDSSSGSQTSRQIIDLKAIEDDEISIVNSIYGETFERLDEVRQKAVTFAGEEKKQESSKKPSEVSFNPFLGERDEEILLNENMSSDHDQQQRDSIKSLKPMF